MSYKAFLVQRKYLLVDVFMIQDKIPNIDHISWTIRSSGLEMNPKVGRSINGNNEGCDPLDNLLLSGIKLIKFEKEQSKISVRRCKPPAIYKYFE